MKGRCPICDSEDTNLTHDPFEKDYVCFVCANIIQSTSGIDWYIEDLGIEDYDEAE